jgi:GGDEF domain-containing protein
MAGNLVFKFLPKGSPEYYLYEQLQFKANTDKLTRCFNKPYFFDALHREVLKQKASASALSLIICNYSAQFCC